jgi:hypothetical protein
MSLTISTHKISISSVKVEKTAVDSSAFQKLFSTNLGINIVLNV